MVFIMVTTTFKVVGNDRGNYYHNSTRVIIYLQNHECIEDIYKTITHEMIHHCINEAGEEMDDDQEEALIFAIQWAEETLV